MEPLSQAQAEQIALWHYPEPFSFYDWNRGSGRSRGVAGPGVASDAYFAVRDREDDLIGYFSYRGSTNGGDWEFVEMRRPA